MNLNFALLFVLFVVLCNIHDSHQQRREYATHGDNPVALAHKKEYAWVIITKLHALNLLIFKDLIVKLRLAEKLQEKYKGTLAYELGIITAGILETFRDMLDTYYYFTNPNRWKHEHNINVEYHLNVYFYMQGCYMEILHDKDMYQAILDNYLARKKAKEKEKLKQQIREYRMQFTTRQRMFTSGGDFRRGRGGTPPSDKEYKRMLRLKKWGEKWNYFDPVKEGIDINVKFDKEQVMKAMKMKKLKKK